MDIFNSNRKLEEVVMYSIDWAMYLRSKLTEPFIPFICLAHGENFKFNILTSDQNPLEFAKSILKNSTDHFQQFVIVTEGYLGDSELTKQDAVLAHGFDITQEKGVLLGQKFIPREKFGSFKKDGKVQFLGHPEIPLPVNSAIEPNCSVDEVSFNAVAYDQHGLTSYAVFIGHSNPSVIANTIKRFLRSKLSTPNSSSLSGEFQVEINSSAILDGEFLKFLVINAVNEERASEYATKWEKENQRKLTFSIKAGDNSYLHEIDLNQSNTSLTPDNLDLNTSNYNLDYTKASLEELDQEFYRIVSIPNARTNIQALTEMTDLMQEYDKRGCAMPDVRHSSKPKSNPKPWWKFW